VSKSAITLLVITLLLLTVGVVMLFSTSAAYARERYGDAHYLLKRQLIWMTLAGAACVMAASVPYPRLRQLATPALAAALVLLVAVLIPGIGAKIGGSRRWIPLPGLQVQPSEFAKLALVLWLAHWLAREKRRLDRFGRGFAVPVGVIGLTLALILAEPDFGCTALLGAVALAMLFVAGVRLRYLAPTVLAGAGGFVLLMLQNPERSRRLLAFMDLEKYKQGAGYQVWQAMLAFGSGGVSGLGLGNGRQKMFYLPEAHTDFIFPIMGEELGLIGSLAVLAAFAALVACGLRISLKAADPFGQYLGLGVVMLIALQALINIGVVTAWLPTKGLPLPFVSYGGSNLMVNMLCVGLLFSIHRHGLADAAADDPEFFARRSSVT
jgi:cell division protein FtsW